MNVPESLDAARAWLNAVNHREVDLALQRSDPEIEIVGPRGSGRGHALLREWMGNARVHLETRRTFCRGDAVVVSQRGTWRSPETGEVTGEAEVASRFRVAGGRVALYARHDSLDAALAEAGLGPADEVA